MIDIRKFTEDDVDSIYNLEMSVYSDFYSEQTIENDLISENSTYYCIYSNGVFAGYINIGLCIDFIEIYRITVAEPFRKKGYALLLLEKAEKLCIENNVPQLLLEVREGNAPARRLYEKFGFCECGTRKKLL